MKAKKRKAKEVHDLYQETYYSPDGLSVAHTNNVPMQWTMREGANEPRYLTQLSAQRRVPAS